MKCIRVAFVATLALSVGAACADEVPTGPTGPQVGIEIAPLELEGIDEVCYTLTVTNGDPEDSGTDIVWTEANVCSVQFGNGEGGGISYVGPCDASVSNINNNYVSLELTSIKAGGTTLTAGTDYINPCPSTGPCVRDFKCEENGDVFVEFNLTVMRAARQGFFDIAVNFEDIFCSAKLDTCYDVGPVRATVTGNSALAGYRYTRSDVNYVGVWLGTADADWDLYAQADGSTIGSFKGGAADDPPTAPIVGDFTYTLSTNPGTPINLLHGPGDVGRQHTAVVGLACTAGPDADGSKLLLSTPTITCGTGENETEITLDLATGDGADGGNGEVTITDNTTLRYALYFGKEQLNCGVDGAGDPISCNKIYYNIAFNIAHLAGQSYRDCTFTMGATAVDTADTTTFAGGALADPNAIYPGVAYNAITIIGANGPICTANPLNGTGSGVQTMYVKGANYSGTAGQPYVAKFETTGGQATEIGQTQD